MHIRQVALRFLAFFRGRRADAELSREIAAHLQLLEDQFAARGMAPPDARAAARRAFGGSVLHAAEAQRAARTFRALDDSWLDIKLAGRMLVRYPGLTVVATLGMALAIAIAAGAFAVTHTMLSPSIPIDEGHRVVALQVWNQETNRPERRLAHEFLEWRTGLRSFEAIGAFRAVSRNLLIPGRTPEMIRVAEMTASAFQIARVPPVLGRPLLPTDGQPGAPAALVIGADEWRVRFGGDAAVIGRSVQLGADHHTIVGVMPTGFGFPVNHQFWIPLRVEASAASRLTGPELMLFGRLAAGATPESARAELTTAGQQLATSFPESHAPLRPTVLPYTYPFSDMDEPENQLGMRLLQFLVVMLLILVAVNVAILVYARTATRHAEIAVRSALGASRRRIVAQLFVEALALSLLAAVIGLILVAVAMREIAAALLPVMGQLPFWLELRLTPAAVAYALALAVIAAGIVGVVPALKATGRHVRQRLQDLSGGRNAGVRLGTTWTLLIVGQVAVAAALLPTAVYHAWYTTQHGLADPGYPAHEFLRARMVMDGAPYGARLDELLRRLRGEPGVRDVTFALAGPGEEPVVWAALDGIPLPSAPADFSIATGTSLGHQVRINRVDAAWFEAFGIRVLAGRALTEADAHGDAVIVSESFAARFLGGGTPLGQRLRYVGASGDASAGDVDLTRWYEVVGVVPDFPIDAPGRTEPRIYHAAAPGQVQPAVLALRVRSGRAPEFAPRLREIATSVDPTLQLHGVDRLDGPARTDRSFYRMIALALVAITLSVVVLSAAGVYALMSCIVAQRRKEIGVRAALGGNARRILASIFMRALAQLSLGAAAGMGVALLVAPDPAPMAGYQEVIVPLVALFLIAVGAAATFVPARRALRLSPTDALRAE